MAVDFYFNDVEIGGIIGTIEGTVHSYQYIYAPAKIYDPPEQCHPDESELEIFETTIEFDDGLKITPIQFDDLPDDLQDTVKAACIDDYWATEKAAKEDAMIEAFEQERLFNDGSWER